MRKLLALLAFILGTTAACAANPVVLNTYALNLTRSNDRHAPEQVVEAYLTCDVAQLLGPCLAGQPRNPGPSPGWSFSVAPTKASSPTLELTAHVAGYVKKVQLANKKGQHTTLDMGPYHLTLRIARQELQGVPNT